MYSGILQQAVGRIADRVAFDMVKLGKSVKAGIVAGVCGIGLCALAKKLKLSSRVAEIAQSVEAVPFPGARLYTFLASRGLRPLYAAVADDVAKADHFERILDLGTGVGYLPIELAKRDSATVIGVDASSEMIRIANANALASGVAKAVEFATGDFVNLPFPGRYFDLVVGVNVLHHWHDPLAVFEEVYHVLVPGGQFWIYDYRRDCEEECWKSLETGLPFMQRLALQFGPMASSRVAYSERKLTALASKTHFENPTIEQVTLPLFGKPMPVFVRMKLHKPAHNGQ